MHLLRSFAHLEGEEPFSKSGGSHLYSAFVACVDFEIVPEWDILDSFLSVVTNLYVECSRSRPRPCVPAYSPEQIIALVP